MVHRGIHFIWNNPAFTISDIAKGQCTLIMLITIVDGFNFWLYDIYDLFCYREILVFWQELEDLSALCMETGFWVAIST